MQDVLEIARLVTRLPVLHQKVRCLSLTAERGLKLGSLEASVQTHTVRCCALLREQLVVVKDGLVRAGLLLPRWLWRRRLLGCPCFLELEDRLELVLIALAA